ncbi:hypothetical protein HDV64DRAFT_91355 [Trichoderma sp. TUCIM 5745]
MCGITPHHHCGQLTLLNVALSDVLAAMPARNCLSRGLSEPNPLSSIRGFASEPLAPCVTSYKYPYPCRVYQAQLQTTLVGCDIEIFLLHLCAYARPH